MDELGIQMPKSEQVAVDDAPSELQSRLNALKAPTAKGKDFVSSTPTL